ncbi:MAG TPA: chaperonin GroEL, partial [Pseudorhodoferax sp.]|nr:chaperonin GroEL [Pseudorhodoferax sp.]
MTIKELSMGHAAQLALCAGVDVLADAVKSTLGPAGRHVALERPGGPPHATKDGAAVAGAIELRGRIENAAAQIVQQAAQRTADEVGDGTTTATVLAQAIFHEGVRHLAVGADASRLKQGIDQAARQMLDALAELSIPCSDRAALRQVATMAANADAEIGSLVAQALETVGHDGVVQVEAGRGLHSALHLVDGMQWEVGFASEHFANDAPRQRVHLEHPLVLVVAGALDAWRPLAHLLERVAASRQSLVIVAETFAADVMALLVANAQARSLGLCAVKAPGVGNRRGEILEDLALFAGSGHIAPASGFSLEQLDLAQLGSVDRFDADPRRTIFSAGPGHALAMQARLDPLRRRASQTNDVREREQLQQRVALLTGAVAVLRIGAATELEYRAKLDRA